MNFLDKLERKYGKYAIKNLMLYIVIGNAFAFIFSYVNPALSEALSFNLNAILHGEIWRIVTFIFIPPTYSLWFIIIALVYYSIGTQLEHVWGSFKFNVYYFTGALSTALICSILYFFGYDISGTTYYINLSIFLAFFTLFPDTKFYIYFLVPIKAKYLAILDVILLAIDFFGGSLPIKVLIVVSLLNYLLFFAVPLLKGKRTPTQKSFHEAKKRIPKGSADPIKVAFHKCTVCGKTELDDPDMEFRYCSSCEGNYEYCMDHLKNHEHIK